MVQNLALCLYCNRIINGFFPNLFRLLEKDWISGQFLRRNENNAIVQEENNFHTTKTHKSIDWKKFSSFNRLIEAFRKPAKGLKTSEN
jgi:hypothetical protein